MNITNLFVYGTLAPGKPNAHILADVEGTWTRATVRATLYEQGWGAALGFPGLVLNETAAEVEGLVFSSEALPAMWQQLDEFEGEGYERVVSKALLDNGQIVSAYVYQIVQGN